MRAVDEVRFLIGPHMKRLSSSTASYVGRKGYSGPTIVRHEVDEDSCMLDILALIPTCLEQEDGVIVASSCIEISSTVVETIAFYDSTQLKASSSGWAGQWSRGLDRLPPNWPWGEIHTSRLHEKGKTV